MDIVAVPGWRKAAQLEHKSRKIRQTLLPYLWPKRPTCLGFLIVVSILLPQVQPRPNPGSLKREPRVALKATKAEEPKAKAAAKPKAKAKTAAKTED